MSENTRKNFVNMSGVAMLDESDFLTILHTNHQLVTEAENTPPEIPLVPDLFNSFPKFADVPYEWYTVKKIGSEDVSSEKKEKYFSEKCAEFARLLSYSSVPFSIRCRADKDRGVLFEVGLYGDEYGTRLKSMLKAVFGIAEIEKAAVIDTDNKSEWYSRCLPLKCKDDELDSMSLKFESPLWADEVLGVLTGTDCCVCISFAPAESNWINERLDVAYNTENNICEFLKYHRQVSSNYTESVNGTGNSNKLISIHKKSESTSEGASYALSCSDDLVFVNSKVESAEKRVKYFIRLMEQMGKNGWLVKMTVEHSYSYREQAAAARNALGASLNSMGYSCEWSRIPRDEKLASLFLPVHFATALVSLPTRDFVGFSIEQLCELNLNLPEEKAGAAKGIDIGTLLCNGEKTKISVTIPRSELNRHAFVCGMTGSGKTNTVCSLLSSVEDINYMVVEPVKGEYHSLPGVRRYTMVTGDSNALLMNPFWFPEGSSLQYHIDSLKLIISSAFDLYAAMPNILEQCLYRVYNNCGWDFISGCNIYADELPKEDLYPTFRSLSDEIDRYLDEKFSGELQDNYRGALLSRVQSFTTGAKGALLNTTAHIPFEKWAEENIVVELDALADDADKAIVMGALLVQYFQYIKHGKEHKAADGLRHLVVLEEAHHLFQENASKSGEGQNASEQLVKMLNNLLAEIRAYGEGFLIVDQSPSAISTSVLKNTGVKIAHRVDYGEDIKLLESVLLLKEDNKKTAYLDKGEALVRYGSMALPAHIKVPLCKSKEECVLHKGSTGNVSVSAAYDRILSNNSLMDVLKEEAVRLLNLILLEKNFNVISKGFEEFRNMAYRLIVFKCGWENASLFTSGGNYMPLLDSCIIYACENEFPGQYCLCRMVRMYVIRMASVLEESEEGRLTAKEQEVFSDYRANKLYPRISFYFDNAIEPETQSVCNLIGSVPEIRVICRLVNAMWGLSKEERVNQADELVNSCFITPPSKSETMLIKTLAIRYIDECRK